MKGNSPMKKLIYFTLCGFISAFITTLLIFLFIKFDLGVLFFYAFGLSFLGSLAGTAFWYIKYRELFETFLVFLCYFLTISFLAYLGPTTVDRSLSVFVYFYAVEENGIPENYQNERYFKEFTQRRLDDGIKTGMLSKEGHIYKPTIKSKMLYGIFYPTAVITGTDKAYKTFKKSVKEKK